MTTYTVKYFDGVKMQESEIVADSFDFSEASKGYTFTDRYGVVAHFPEGRVNSIFAKQDR